MNRVCRAKNNLLVTPRALFSFSLALAMKSLTKEWSRLSLFEIPNQVVILMDFFKKIIKEL